MTRVRRARRSPPTTRRTAGAATAGMRPELAELRARVAATLDAGRPGGHRAPARRRAADGAGEHRGPVRPRQLRGVRRARHRRPAGAPQHRGPAWPTRRPTAWSPGIGRVNGDLFDDERSRCAVLSYDYSVLAGTQGQMNHRKKDRLFELVERLRLPVVLFAEGGGGRPGDTDMAVVTGLDTEAFALLRRPERAGAAGRRRVGPLLRRQRRAARMLPRHHRHARRQHRDGRARP